jgi:hypothetical protein
MRATMQRLGVMPSFSRPSVSNDNPFSESLFRTVKYCPLYPTRPFASLDAARAWVAIFIQWYDDEHLHSSIRFTTPATRHAGTDTAILANRARVYHAAQRTHPSRWSGATRNWTKIARVTLNGLKEGVPSATTEHRRTASGRSRDRDRERFPQAEGQLIETGRAHPGSTHGSDVTPIVDPRATERETNSAPGGNIRKEEPDTSWATETGHVNGRSTITVTGLNEGAGSASRANRGLTS